jgi:hypothetical protein
MSNRLRTYYWEKTQIYNVNYTVNNSDFVYFHITMNNQFLLFLAELQRSCSRLMFWRKAGGRAYVSLSSLTR